VQQQVVALADQAQVRPIPLLVACVLLVLLSAAGCAAPGGGPGRPSAGAAQYL